MKRIDPPFSTFAVALSVALVFVPGLALGAAGGSGSGDAAGAAAPGEEFAAGEAAFGSGDNAAAERHYRRVLEIDPNHLRALIRLATVVSWSDRLEESISYYERALTMDPGSVEIRLGLARTLSWDGQFDRASAIYTKLVQEAPQDFAAQNGLAAVLSWQGHLDRALALYDRTLQADPGNREAMSGRARVLYWQGRTPQASGAVGDALSVNPTDRDSLKLRYSIRAGMAPVLDASAGFVDDSDHNEMSLRHAGGTHAPRPGVTLGGSIDWFYASQPLDPTQTAPSDPKLHERLLSPKVLGIWRVGSDLGVSGSAGVDIIEGDASTTHFSGSAGVDYRLSDRWSFSGALSQSVFAATAASLKRGVGIGVASATAGFTPLPRLGTRLTLERDAFSDENSRDLLAAYARWSIPSKRPKIGLSWSLRDLGCDQRGTGYFCPHAYTANVVGLDVADRIGKRFGWSAVGSLGLQRVQGDAASGHDTDAVSGYHVAATWDFDSGVTAEAYVGHTNLALAMGSGFASTEFGFRVRWRIGEARPNEGERIAPGTGGQE